MRRVTAARLQQASRRSRISTFEWNAAPTPLLAVRTQITEAHVGGLTPTVTDFIVLAIAHALRKFPEANSTWTDTLCAYIEPSISRFAVKTPNGLITPVIRDADSKNLRAISSSSGISPTGRGRAASGRRSYAGGTFTVSNLGCTA